MPDEQNYESHLLPIEEALKLVSGGERKILQYAWEIYCFTLTELEKQRLEPEQNEIGPSESQESSESSSRSLSL